MARVSATSLLKIAELVEIPELDESAQALLLRVKSSLETAAAGESEALTQVTAHIVRLIEAVEGHKKELERRNELLSQALRSSNPSEVVRQMSWSDRCRLIKNLLEQKLSAIEIGRRLNISDATVLNWKRATMLIPEVLEALEEGEQTGIGVRNLRFFFDHTSNGHNIEAKPVEQQRQLLKVLRGNGRGGVQRAKRTGSKGDSNKARAKKKALRSAKDG